MGFSPWGAAVSLAVLAPNLLLWAFPPRIPAPATQTQTSWVWLERCGQALCLVVPAITEPGEFVHWFSAPALAALTAYYALWVRYLVTGRRYDALYRSYGVVPVPMAILPVVVFLSTAAWLTNPWIAGAAVILAAGHIPVSVITARALATQGDQRPTT